MILDFKEQIVGYLNVKLNKTSSEAYVVSDIFYNSDPRSGRLHPLGYKLLKDDYEFFSCDLDFDATPQTIISLTKYVNGLYYISTGKKSKIYSTNQDYINMVILMGNKIT